MKNRKILIIKYQTLMKKLLLLAFVSVTMMAAVSCSKDDDKSSASLVGTLWVADVNYTDVPMLGSGSIEVQLYFKNDSTCRIDADLPATIQMAMSALGIGNLQPGDYPYTFDGSKVTLQVSSGSTSLDYTGNTLVFHIPDQYSIVIPYLGGPDVVFNKQ